MTEGGQPHEPEPKPEGSQRVNPYFCYDESMWNEIAQWIRGVAATFVTAATVVVTLIYSYSSGWLFAGGAIVVIGMFVVAQVIENKLGEPRACP